MAALIGAMRATLSADTAKFESGMRRAATTATTTSSSIQKALGGIKIGFAGIAAGLSVGLITNAIKSALEYAGSLGELASTLGLTTKDLQTFRFAAGQVGVSQEELENGIQKLTISMGKAQLGAKAQADAFRAVGISMDQIKGKDAGEVFRLLADKLQNVSDRSERAAVEVALFGKAGAKLDNLLSGSESTLSELSDAAERLGIVLSDEQIQKADETADKLAAIKTVISANIAGVVADNADAILDLANAFGELVSVLARVVGWMARTSHELAAMAPQIVSVIDAITPGAAIARFFGSQVSSGNGNASSLTVKLPPARPAGGVKPVTVKPFLAQSGGGRQKEDHTAEDQLRDAKQFADELSRAQQDVLRATTELSHNADERVDLQLRQLDMERDDQERELQYQVALNKLTKGKEGLTAAQARQLESEYVKADLLKRQQILGERATQQAQDAADIADKNYDLAIEQLQLDADLTETSSERRALELRILDAMKAQEKARLEAVIADQTSSDLAKAEAQARLGKLDAIYAGRQAVTVQQTRGPVEDYLASLPTTAAKANEALQQLEVQGMSGFIDSVLALSDGVGSATKSLLDTLKQFVLGLAKLQLQQALGGAVQGGGGGFLGALLGSAGSLFGGGASFGALYGAANAAPSLVNATAGLSTTMAPIFVPGFASGGSGRFKGIPGIDRNILSMNGTPFARVSYGEHMTISNDNKGGGMDTPAFVFNNYARMSPDEARRTGAQAAAGWNAQMARARTKGIS